MCPGLLWSPTRAGSRRASMCVWEAVGRSMCVVQRLGAAPPWVDGALPLPNGEGAYRPGVACWPLAVLGTSGAGRALSSDPGDLFLGLFSVPPPAGPLGSIPQKRHRPPPTRRGCGLPSCASVHGACSASPAWSLRCLLCWVAYPPTWTSVQSELCDVCFRGSGSVRASMWGHALAFRGRLLPF